MLRLPFFSGDLILNRTTDVRNLLPDVMTSQAQEIAAAWAERAKELAHWTLAHLVNRTDIWVQYLPPDQRSYSKIVRTAPPRAMRGSAMLTPELIARHYAGGSVGDLIGLHSQSVDHTSRWVGIDVGSHDSKVVATASANFKAAVIWHEALCKQGCRAILEDSSGRGDYHILVLLEIVGHAGEVNAFGRGLVSNYADLGLSAAPRVFPHRGRAQTAGTADWLRLPGRHHSHTHWSRIWNGSQWLEGADAVSAILTTAVRPAHDGPLPPSAQPDEAEISPSPQGRLRFAEQGEEALRYLKQLDPARADNQEMWLQVGVILHHLDHGPEMLAEWDRWSRQGRHYQPGRCAERWAELGDERTKPRGVATLVSWVREDASPSSRGRPPGHADLPCTPHGALSLAAERPASNDPELAFVAAAWPDLAPAVKTGILAMVHASQSHRPSVPGA